MFPADERVETGKFTPVNGREIFPSLRSKRKRGLPLKIPTNFRTEFPENYLTIWLQTEISGYFRLACDQLMHLLLKSAFFIDNWGFMYQSIPKPPVPLPGQPPGIWLVLSSVQWGIWPKMRPARWGIWLSCLNVCQRSETKGFRNSLIQHVSHGGGHRSCRFHVSFSVVVDLYNYIEEYAVCLKCGAKTSWTRNRICGKCCLCKRASFADGVKCWRYQEIREIINRRNFKYIYIYVSLFCSQFSWSIWEPFKKPMKRGLSKKNIFIEIKNVRKIVLRAFGYFSCVFI